MRCRTAAAALAAACLLAAAPGAGAADDEAKPLPVAKTAILKSGGTYFVEGRVRIPKGVEITVQKDTKIVGRGEDAAIEVVGALAIHGVTDGAVAIAAVTIEVQAKFESLRVDMAVFSGRSRGIVTPKDTPCDGRIVVLNTEFKETASVDVTMSGNEVDLQRVYMAAPARVRAVDPPGSPGNRVKLNVLNCCTATGIGVPGALMGGIVVERVADVTVRGTRICGDTAKFADCGAVEFDGNQVKCATLEFAQSAPGRFGRTSISNCDLLCEKIVVWSPAAPGKAESIPCDKCWFDGETNEKTVRDKYLRDKDDDPKCGVTVKLTKLMERPLLLAGKIAK